MSPTISGVWLIIFCLVFKWLFGRVSAHRRINVDVDKKLPSVEANKRKDAVVKAGSPKVYKYDVFINHRGPDVKLTFAAHLEEALCNAGFHPFLDAKSVGQGRHVFNSIDEALSDASVHVAIFSRRYAESKYCLQELSDMLQTQKVILPVFYDVQPKDLKDVDRGPYAPAFQKHWRRGKVEETKQWRQALREVADRRGFTKDEFAGNEVQLVKSIVVEVCTQMPAKLESDTRRFGIEESLHDALQQLDAMPRDGVGILGLHGTGGIGKTTLADELYRSLLASSHEDKFQVHSFLKDVRSNAPSHLQRQLVRDLFRVDIGRTTMPYRKWFNRFKSQKVLIVVDDIDHVSQFTKLIPELPHLAPGSRVVVTSRHLDVLHGAMRPAAHKAVYEVKDLKCTFARQLFNWHAFRSEEPDYDDFRELAEKVADACSGLPLALETNGASLFDKKDPEADRLVWMDAIKALKENDNILDKQQASWTIPSLEGHYTWTKSWRLPRPGEGIVSFTAEGSNSIHVAISISPETQVPMYEIVIGGWGNISSAIRRRTQGQNLIFVATVGVINPRSPNRFWVSIDKRTSIIQIGRGEPSDQDILIQYIDPYFILEAQFITFTTWDVPITYSNVEIRELEHIPGTSHNVEIFKQQAPWTILPLDGHYTWINSWRLRRPGQGIVSFTAEGLNDIHVAISTSPETRVPMYEIVIGGWGNVSSAIRRRAQGRNLTFVATVDVINPTNPNRLWVSIDKRTNIIQIGRGEPSDQDILSEYIDPYFILKAQFISFTTWDVPITYSNVEIRELEHIPGTSQHVEEKID